MSIGNCPEKLESSNLSREILSREIGCSQSAHTCQWLNDVRVYMCVHNDGRRACMCVSLQICLRACICACTQAHVYMNAVCMNNVIGDDVCMSYSIKDKSYV